jgi:hypothetical protein
MRDYRCQQDQLKQTVFVRKAIVSRRNRPLRVVRGVAAVPVIKFEAWV